MALLNVDTRESYVTRHAEGHLELAKRHHELGNTLSMWLQLLTWVQAEEIYGDHWDRVHRGAT